MTVSGIDAFALREPVSGIEYCVLRVQTDTGLRGFGECLRATATELAAARKFWMGKAATSYATATQELPLAGAMDMALLDLVGKQCKAPVHRVLGGPTRNKVRAYASIKLESFGAAADSGYRAFGLPVPLPSARNQGQAYQIAIRKLADLVRRRGGDFVLEGADILTPGDAASVAVTAQALHPLWFDEPCAISNQQTIHKIADESVVPLGFGKDIKTAGVFQDLLRASLVDVVRPDLLHFGITQTRRIAALAETYYTAVSPRHEGGPVATAAALHLAASLPNFFIQQIPFPEAAADRAMRAAIAGADVERVKDGFAALSTLPGLGITVNESALEKYHAS